MGSKMTTQERRNELRKGSTDVFLNWLKSTPRSEKERNELLKDRCRYDIPLYAETFFPHYCTHPFNNFHDDLFKAKISDTRPFRRAWAAPRGFAKSSILTLIDALHDVCYALEDFIIVVSNTDDLSVAKLKDIRDEVLSNDELRAVYGIHFKQKRPGETNYEIHISGHKTAFMSFGARAQVRGVRRGANRPSKIIVDDYEHTEEVFSERLRDKREQTFHGDIVKTGNEKTNVQVVGTILHRQSLLRKLLDNPAYKGNLYRSIIDWPIRTDLWEKWKILYLSLENKDRLHRAQQFYEQNKKEMLKGSKVGWPEKEDLLYLMKEKLELGDRAWFQEKQNQPMGSEDKVFENIWWYRETPQGIHLEKDDKLIPWAELKHSAYGVIDPATGQEKKKRGGLLDFACILVGYQTPSGRILVHKDWTRRASPSKQITEIFNHHTEFEFQKFGVETNLYRNLMLPNIIEERKRLEKTSGKLVKIPFYDIENTEKKDSRIHRVEPKVNHGWIMFNRTLSQEFKSQIEDYPHNDHDDCPDALDMLWGLVHNRYNPAAVSIDAMGSV